MSRSHRVGSRRRNRRDVVHLWVATTMSVEKLYWNDTSITRFKDRVRWAQSVINALEKRLADARVNYKQTRQDLIDAVSPWKGGEDYMFLDEYQGSKSTLWRVVELRPAPFTDNPAVFDVVVSQVFLNKNVSKTLRIVPTLTMDRHALRVVPTEHFIEQEGK